LDTVINFYVKNKNYYADEIYTYNNESEKLFKEINKLNKLINDTKTNNIKHSNLVEEYKNNFQKK